MDILLAEPNNLFVKFFKGLFIRPFFYPLAKGMGVYLFLFGLILIGPQAYTQNIFRPIAENLPTPNSFRLADGQPGPDYFQQKVDYRIDVTLDEKKKTISGNELITYHNNAPVELGYLWIQLDQNTRAADAERYLVQDNSLSDPVKASEISRAIGKPFDSDMQIISVKDQNGADLKHRIDGTMMQVIMVKPIIPGGVYRFKIEWTYSINDVNKVRGRSGYETFEKDGNSVFCIAQFYPRLALYDDINGWEVRQFHGQSEFGLEFGDFEVNITVPENHIVGATGELINTNEVLGSELEEKYSVAKRSPERVFIISEKEALENLKSKAGKTKTWKFKAEKVRDFAFASSQRFIWEGKNVKIGERNVFAHSMYPPEANPIWELNVTKAIEHTLISHSERTFEYPYPHALAVHLNRSGMEYPMICFNGRRPDDDGSYSEYQERRLISLIIHEIGHNFFPMIVNSNERAWAWMDEGLNVFMEYHAEKGWDPDYPSRRGTPKSIIGFMSKEKGELTPIMTPPDIESNLSLNDYWKTSAVLNLLRDLILGPEAFDHAFRTYANRWKFKHPTPADFFRTMEDASGRDLGWFWRSWFFSTDHVDISIDTVQWFTVEGNNYLSYKSKLDHIDSSQGESLKFNDLLEFGLRSDTSVVETLRENWNRDWGQKLPKKFHLYDLRLKNIGGIPMPISLRVYFENGGSEDFYYPAEVWAKDNSQFSKVIMTEKEVSFFEVDPERKSSDIVQRNNRWPRGQ